MLDTSQEILIKGVVDNQIQKKGAFIKKYGTVSDFMIDYGMNEIYDEINLMNIPHDKRLQTSYAIFDFLNLNYNYKL